MAEFTVQEEKHISTGNSRVSRRKGVANNSDWIKKVFLNILAVCCLTATVSIVACAPFQKKLADIEAHRQLEQYRKNLGKGLFETVVQQSNEVLYLNDINPPAEVALYALGEVYAHHDYEDKDYVISQYYFERLIKNFPDSPLTAEAKVYISLFETIAIKEEAVAEKELSIQKAILDSKETKYVHVPVPRKKVIKDKNFEEAAENNMQMLARARGKKPADKAMYNLGLIYAHAENPDRDYSKSQAFFHILTEQFPKSEYAEEARIWLGLFETIEEIQQIDIEIEQQKRKLTQ